MYDSTVDPQYPGRLPRPGRAPWRQRLGKCLSGCAWLAIPLAVTSLALSAFLFLPMG